MRRILRLPGVMEKTGLGRSSIYRMVKDGEFPKPVKLGPRLVVGMRKK
jgi:prophage regulatory protein